METVRLEVLRQQAGTGAPEGLPEALSALRRVGEKVDRVLEERRGKDPPDGTSQ